MRGFGAVFKVPHAFVKSSSGSSWRAVDAGSSASRGPPPDAWAGSRSRCSCAACAPSGCVDRPTPPKPFLSGRRMCAHPIRASQPCGSRFANKRPQPNASPESARRPGNSARKRPFLRGRRTAGALPAFGPVKKRDEVLTSMNVGVPETPRVWHTRKRPPGADRFSRPPFLPKPTHKTASRSHDRQCR